MQEKLSGKSLEQQFMIVYEIINEDYIFIDPKLILYF